MERVTYEDLGPLVAALHAGATVAIPTDTVYGLACAAHDRPACETLLRAKGRSLAQPSAIVAGTVAGLLAERGFTDVEVTRDLAGIDRYGTGRWSG